MTSSFVDAIRGGKPQIGVLATFDSPEVCELLAAAGYDWLFVDMEHATLSAQAVQRMAMAAQGRGAKVIVRVPEGTPGWIKQALELGSDGVIVPLVNSEEDALRAVKAAKYSPIGERSVGIARAHGYGATFAEYVASANASVALVLQIEHRAAVESLDAILSVEGFDAVFIGPYDLSGSMNKLGKVSDPEVVAAIDGIKKAAVAAGIPFGIFVGNAGGVAKELESGASFVAVGIDSMLLSKAASESLTLSRGN